MTRSEAKTAAREEALQAMLARLAAYDSDGKVAPACAEISRLLEGECQAVADVFLDRFLGDPEVRRAGVAMAEDARQRQRRDSALYVRQKYAHPLGLEWLDMALRNAARCHKSGVPMHAYLSATSAAHSAVVAAIEAAAGDDVARVCRLTDIVQRLAMVEAAVMAEHYSQRDDAKRRHERQAQAEAFRDSIGVTLDATAQLGSRAHSQAENA